MSESAREKLRLIAALKDALDGMEDMIGYVSEYFQWKWDHQGYIDRAKAVLAEFEEDASEPRGDSSDSPAPGEARLPGGSDDYLAATPAGRDTRVDWPVIPEGYKAVSLGPAYVSVDCINFYEVPDGTSISDFLQEIRGNETPGSAAKNY